MNHFLLHLLVRDIGETLRGLRIETVRLLRPLAVIRLGGRGAPRFLVVVISNPGPFCFLDSVDPLADTGDDVFRRIWGDRIAAVPEAPHDRILRLPLEKSQHTLAVSLRGSAARIRVEGPDTIVESLDTRETGEAAGPQLPPGESLTSLPDLELAKALDAGREVHGVERPLLDAFGGEDGLDSASLVGFRNGVRDRVTPFCLGAEGRPGRVVPLPAGDTRDHPQRRVEYLFGPFHDAGDACAAVGRDLVDTVTGAILERHALPIRKRLAGRQILLDKLRVQLAEAADFEAGRREANILAAYQSQVPAGAAEVELPDLYTPGETVTIRLDPTLPLKSQIEKRFKRATKRERSRDALARRITVVEEEIRGLESAIAEAGRAETFRDALLGLRAAAGTTGVRRPRTAARGQAEKRYRRFDLDPLWFALVGRSDRENDDITFRVAGPDDIWMHAGQTAGSHVVLKSSGGGGNPSREILERAAAIAAFYSKARHSGLVPVIYTQRKYVRKFRGAKPGQVTCEREKTLFVEPKLPE